MKKIREDGTNRYRLIGTKELLCEVLEIGQNDLTIRENEILIEVLIENLSFTKAGKKRDLTRERVKQIYQQAFKKLIKKVRSTKNRVLENATLHEKNQELEELLKSHEKDAEIYNEKVKHFNSLPEKTRELLNTNIRNTNLAARAKNSCRPYDIITVSDLVRLDSSDVLKWRNIGKGTLAEIEVFLAENGLKWKML